jgi:hypothetical protein
MVQQMLACCGSRKYYCVRVMFEDTMDKKGRLLVLIRARTIDIIISNLVEVLIARKLRKMHRIM